MLQLRESEKIMLIMRKHWFVMARTAIVFALAVLIPIIIFVAFSFLKNSVEINPVRAGVSRTADGSTYSQRLISIVTPDGSRWRSNGVNVSAAEPVINFLVPVYLMALLALLLLVWMDFYLDMWVITSERLIDVEQKGLFSREIAEIPLRHVQDVTLEVNGIIETFLKFGTIRIQTAGEREFIIQDVPNLYEAKDLILKYSALQNGVGTKK